MLFSNICVVEAAVSSSFSYSWTVHWTWDYYTNTGSAYTTGAGSEWFELVFNPSINSTSITSEYMKERISEISVSVQNCDYWYITDCFGTVVYSPNYTRVSSPYTVVKTNEFEVGGSSNIYYVLHVHLFGDNNGWSAASYYQSSTVSISGNVTLTVADSPASSTYSVSDSSTHSYLNSLNETAEETQSTAEDTNQTTHSIFDSITDFFSSFFENIINALISVFVPEDGYFSDWFDRLNTLLSEKLGMLYAPFDLIISTLQAIYSADSTETGIPFPGIQWQDTWLVEPFTFSFDSLGDSFDDLREKVYFATDTVLVFTFLLLLQSKIKLILEGSE